MVIINSNTLKNVGVCFCFALLLAVAIFCFLTPDNPLNTPLPTYEETKEYVSYVYNRYLAGDDKFNYMEKITTDVVDEKFFTEYEIKNLNDNEITNFEINWGEIKGKLINKKIIRIYEENILGCVDVDDGKPVWDETNKTYYNRTIQDCTVIIGSKIVEKEITESEVSTLLSSMKTGQTFKYRLEADFDYSTCEVVSQEQFYNTVHCKADAIVSFGGYSYPEWDVWEQYKAVWNGLHYNTEEEASGNLTLTTSSINGTFGSVGYSGGGSSDCTTSGCIWNAINWAGDDVSKKITVGGSFTYNETADITFPTDTDTPGNDTLGIRVLMKETATLTEVFMSLSETGTSVSTCKILDGTNNVLTQSSVTGGKCTFNYVLNDDTEYIIAGEGIPTWYRKQNAAPSYPYIGTTLNIVGGYVNQGVPTNNTVYYLISSLTVSYTAPTTESYVGIDACFSEDNSTFADCQTNVTSGTDLGNDTAKYVNWSANFIRTGDGSMTSAKVESVNITYSTPTNPYWESISNTSYVIAYEGSYQNIDNMSLFFRDDNEDYSPKNITFSINNTDVKCIMDTSNNFTLFCDPDSSRGVFSITINGTNNYGLSNVTSFEIRSNQPPTIPTLISPEEHSLNDTTVLNLSCDGSTDPNGDTIYYDYAIDVGYSDSICLNVGTECLWNDSTPNSINTWTCRANNTYTNSTSITTRTIRTETWDVINLTNNTISYGYEGESVNLYSNITWNEIRYKSITGLLNFSGTYYTPTITDYNNYTEMVYTLSLPETSDDTTKLYNWMINLTYHNNSIFENNTYYGEIINKKLYFEGNCTAVNASQSLAVNFSFWSENTNTEFHLLHDDANESGAEIQATITVYKNNIDANDTQVFDEVNITNFGICIPKDEEFKSMMHMDYIEASYDKRQHYFYQTDLNNVTQQTPLYLLDISLGDGISITVKDSSGDYVSDAYIYIYRYYPATNEYKLVSIGHTDELGKDYLYLRKFDVFYKFEVWKAGSKLYEDTINRKIEDDILTITTTYDTIGELLDTFEGISYTLTNTSDNIILTYSDNSTTVSEYCLTVYKWNSSDVGYICNTCLTTKSGTITCDTSDYDGIYVANAWAKINPNKPFATLIVEKIVSIITDFGKTGLFAAFLIILTLGCLGLWMGKVSTTVIGTLLGILISVFLGFLEMSYTAYLGIVIAGIVVIAFAKD